MEKKSTVVTETKTTRVKKAIDPKNKPVIPAKKAGEQKKAEAVKKPATKKKEVPAKQDAKKAINAPATFSESDIAHYDELVTSLKESWSNVQKATMTTAFVLHEVYNTGLYRIDGFKNIYEFGAELFGQSKSTVNRLINIVDRFGEHISNGVPTHNIEEKYSGYSQSQLEAMLGHTDDELKNITPEMSVRDIKKALKSEADETKGKDKESEAIPSGKSADSEKQEERVEKALLIWGFDNAKQWDTMMAPESDLEFKGLLNTIRNCLKRGHKVRIMDVFEESIKK